MPTILHFVGPDSGEYVVFTDEDAKTWKDFARPGCTLKTVIEDGVCTLGRMASLPTEEILSNDYVR